MYDVVLIIYNFVFLFVTESRGVGHDGLVLNEFIRHFEGADFDLQSLRNGHQRVKRSINTNRPHPDNQLRFNFTAHNR